MCGMSEVSCWSPKSSLGVDGKSTTFLFQSQAMSSINTSILLSIFLDQVLINMTAATWSLLACIGCHFPSSAIGAAFQKGLNWPQGMFWKGGERCYITIKMLLVKYLQSLTSLHINCYVNQIVCMSLFKVQIVHFMAGYSDSMIYPLKYRLHYQSEAYDILNNCRSAVDSLSDSARLHIPVSKWSLWPPQKQSTLLFCDIR